MHIHWFPGHMTKALRLIEANCKLVDVIVYVLDARAPFSCLNKSFDKLIFNKSILYVLNKVDLADASKTKLWLEYFKANGKRVVAVEGTKGLSAKILVQQLEDIAKPTFDKFKAKGIVVPIRAMVLGIPNSGKSTIINTLSGKKRTVTGDRPGVTKGKQWVRLENNIELMDTPGTLFPNFDDQNVARHLTMMGSIKEEIVDLIDVALELIAELKVLYPKQFAEKYQLNFDDASNEMLLDEICKKRGFLQKGNVSDLERGAKALLEDFRKCRICKISLEVPNERLVTV